MTIHNMPKGEPFNDGRDLVSLEYVVQTAWKNRYVIAGTLFLCELLAVLYLMFATPQYAANVELVIDPTLSQFITGGTADSQVLREAGALENHIVTLKSRSIARATMDRLNLWDDPDFKPQDGFGLGSLKALLVPSASTEPVSENAIRDRTLVTFQRRLNVGRIGVSNAIEIWFEASTPRKAAKIANGIAEAYLNSLVENRAKAGREAKHWLEERIKSIKDQMNQAAREIQEFRARRDYRILPRGGASVAAADGRTPEDERKSLKELELTAETYQTTFQKLYADFARTVQRETYPISNIRIISRAVEPTDKSWPKTLLVLFLGGAGGIFIGLTLALMRSWLGQLSRPTLAQGDN